jgi:hypothetical protein
LVLLENLLDFDSAIPRFESWRPSHQVLIVYHVLRFHGKSAIFRGLRQRGAVSG